MCPRHSILLIYIYLASCRFIPELLFLWEKERYFLRMLVTKWFSLQLYTINILAVKNCKKIGG